MTLRPRAVNWKNIADNYSDGLHIVVAHPGLTRLFGHSYGVEAAEHVDRMWGLIAERPSAKLSERMYQRRPATGRVLARRRAAAMALLQAVAQRRLRHLSGPDRLHAVSSRFAHEYDDPRDQLCDPDERREMKAARYLNWRINRQVNAEDTALFTRVQQGMMSSSFTSGPTR